MRRLSELNKLAIVQLDANISQKLWIKSATTLFDLGDGLSINDPNEIENAYVYYVKAISVVAEIIPKLRDFKDSDRDYKLLRSVGDSIILAESWCNDRQS